MSPVAESLRGLVARGGLRDASGHLVEALTPLLARAEGLTLEPAARGELPDGGDAVIGLLRYGGGHALGAESDRSFEFLVAITRVPEAEAFIPRLFWRKRDRAESVGGMGFELDEAAAWTESVALTERYHVATSPYQDPNWVRQLLSPEFIDWLVSAPPTSFAFELAYGDLVCSVDPADSADALWSATGTVAARIRAECAEEM